MQRVQEEPKFCMRCGGVMYRRRYGGVLEDLGAFKRRKFCSLSCANMRDNLTKHGYSWRGRHHLKEACEMCEGTQYLAAHHRNQNRTDNRPENIHPLCVVCHAKLHHGSLAFPERQKELQKGWTVCDVSATQSSRSRSTRSSGRSQKLKGVASDGT